MSRLDALRQRAAAIPAPWRRRLLSALGLALSAAAVVVLAYLVYRERDTLLPRLRAASPVQLVFVALLYIVDLGIFALAWTGVARGFGMNLGLARHLRIYVSANAARRLPGTLWYIGGRGALYGRSGVPLKTVLLASGVELALLWVSALAIAVPGVVVLLPQHRWVYGIPALLILVAVVNPAVVRWAVRRTTRGEATGPLPLRRVYGWLGLFVLGWLIAGLVLFAVIASFEPVALAAAPLVVAAWVISATLSMLTFFLPSGLGVMELSLVALLTPVVTPGLAVLTAVAMRVVVTTLDVVFGLAAYAFEAAAKP